MISGEHSGTHAVFNPQKQMSHAFPDASTVEYEHGDHTFECKVITKKDRLLCPIDGCLRRWETTGSLKRHISNKHGIVSRATCYCNECGSEFRERTAGGATNEYCSRECVPIDNSATHYHCTDCGNFITTERYENGQTHCPDCERAQAQE